MIIKPLIAVSSDVVAREARLRALLAGAPVAQGNVSGAEFALEKIAQAYRCHNVSVENGVYDLDWSGTLLPGSGGAPAHHTQDDWLSHPEYRTIGAVVFDIPSGPECASTVLALYRHRDTKDATQKTLLAEFKDVFAKDFAQYWMMTSTRTTYAKNGVDVVEHCRKRTQGRYTRAGVFAGESKQLDASMSLEANAWLGVDHPQEFIDAITWLTGKQVAWLYRCTKEKKDFGRALVLGVSNDDRFDIDANVNVIDNVRPARGVAVRKKSSTGSGGAL